MGPLEVGLGSWIDYDLEPFGGFAENIGDDRVVDEAAEGTETAATAATAEPTSSADAADDAIA